MPSGPFKKCSKCGLVWSERASFLADSSLRMVGYQVDFEELVAGLFLFTHVCGTTVSIPALEFRDLYKGPVFAERLTGAGDCRGHCLQERDLSPCHSKCECAYVREIIQIIRGWPKHDSLTH